jgi:hypothetical protein
MNIEFCIMYNLRPVMLAGEHRGRSVALQHPVIAEPDLLQSVLAFKN